MASFIGDGCVSILESFEFDNVREMVDLERVEALLKTTEGITSPKRIKLSNKSFSKEAALALSQVISGFNEIKTADLSDIIAGRPEMEALITLSTICGSLVENNLVSVNLSDNALGKKGVHACKDVLVGGKLETLYLCNNGLSSEACEYVSSLLLEYPSPNLQTLHFYNNMSGAAGAIALAPLIKSCPKLNDFRFSATRSDHTGCLSIAEALSTTSSLTSLDLSDNTFNLAAAQKLADTLKTQTQLRYLNLRDCALTDEGAAVVLRAVAVAVSPTTNSEIADDKEHRGLTFLDLSGNDCNSATLNALCGGEGPSSTPSTPLLPLLLPSLRELHLDDNSDLGTEGARRLAETLRQAGKGGGGTGPSPALQVLSLEFCEVSAAGAYMLARAVSALPAFQRLKLNGNMISESGVTAVVALLDRRGMTLGDMEDNDVDGDDDLDDVDEEWREEEEEHDEEGDEVAKLTAGMARSMVLTDLPATRSTSVE